MLHAYFGCEVRRFALEALVVVMSGEIFGSPSGGSVRLDRCRTMLHGGTVSAHSDGLDRGSEFTVRLPASEPPALSARTQTRAREQRVVGARGRACWSSTTTATERR